MNRTAHVFYTVSFFCSVYVIYMFFHIGMMKKHLVPTLEMLFSHTHKTLIKDFHGCPSNRSINDTEDILCMEREKFLKNFKNPCWYKVVNTTSGLEKVLRCFPYFHIFGVCKSGTTDLFFRLTQHPQILNNTGIFNKETQFWSWKRYGRNSHGHRNLTLDDFSRFFRADEIGKTKIGVQDRMQYSDLITGHADPMDFWDHMYWRKIPQNDPKSTEPTYLTPHLVKHVQPNIKLILLLREPAERLYSHYLHARYGHTPEEFHNAVVKGIEQFRMCLSNCSLKTCLYKSDLTKDMKLPLTASLYYIHLQEWLEVFPREQFLVLRTEDYHKDMKYSLFQIFSFLGVGAIYSDVVEHTLKLPHRYVNTNRLEQGSMLKETWDILRDFFKEPNRKLAALLNDERYLWKDATFKFKAKQIPKNQTEVLTKTSILDVDKSELKNIQEATKQTPRKRTTMLNEIRNKTFVNKNISKGLQRTHKAIPRNHKKISKERLNQTLVHSSKPEGKMESIQKVSPNQIQRNHIKMSKGRLNQTLPNKTKIGSTERVSKQIPRNHKMMSKGTLNQMVGSKTKINSNSARKAIITTPST